MIVSTGFSVMTMLKTSHLSNEFIYMWLTRDSVVNVLQSIAENSVSTYPSIVSSDLEQIKIVVPTEKESVESNGFLKTVFRTIDYNNKEIRSLELYLNDLVAILLNNSITEGA